MPRPLNMNYIDSDPYDVFIYKHLSIPTCKFFYLCGLNPNSVTLMRFFLTWYMINAIRYSYTVQYYLFPYILCFFLDCVDGDMARVYNMKSKFGYYFDTIIDKFTLISTKLLVWHYGSNNSIEQRRILGFLWGLSLLYDLEILKVKYFGFILSKLFVGSLSLYLLK